MAEVIEQVPLLVACLALVAGALTGKYLAARNPLLVALAVGVLLLVVFFGRYINAWGIGTLVSVGLSHWIAALLSTGLLAYVGGVAFAAVTFRQKPAAA